VGRSKAVRNGELVLRKVPIGDRITFNPLFERTRHIHQNASLNFPQKPAEFMTPPRLLQRKYQDQDGVFQQRRWF
jgi:hypothetical protein